MGLILPPWYFNNCTSSLSGTPATTTPGVNFTAGASNADGSTVTVLSALAHDAHLLHIGICGVSLVNTLTNALLDVMIDPAGGTSWSNFIDDLVVGSTPVMSTGAPEITLWYTFPIYIKSGSSIGVRARTSHTANITTGRVVMHAYGNPSQPDLWWCGQAVESLGINASTSAGTDVPITGTNSSYGAWNTIGTSTHPWGAVQFGINGADSSLTARGYFWQIGYGDTQHPGSPTFCMSDSANETMTYLGLGFPIWCDAPAGTAWLCRSASSGTAPDDFNVAIYGVY